MTDSPNPGPAPEAKPGAPRHLTAVIFAWTRARVLKEEFEKAKRRLERLGAKKTRQSEALTLVDGMPALALWELWLASLQVVVEGYQRSYKHPDSLLSDPAIDVLLDPGHRDALRRFRNTIFHPEFIDHPDAAEVLNDYKNLTEWADALMRQFGQLFRRVLASRRSAGPRSGRR